MQGYKWEDGNMRLEECFLRCRSRNFAYAGLQYGRLCFCGRTFGKYGAAETEAECNAPCTGNPGQTCGGPYRNNIYRVGKSGKLFCDIRLGSAS